MSGGTKYIDGRQLGAITWIVIFSGLFLPLPRIVADAASNAGWLSVVGGGVIGMTGVAAIAMLSTMFPHESFIEVSQKALGQVFGRLMAFSLVAYTCYSTAVLSREFAMMMLTSFLDRTPTGLVLGVFFLLASYATYLGLEATVRAMQFFIPLIALSLVFLIAMAYPVADLRRLQPVIGADYSRVFMGALWIASFFAEMVVLLIIAPHLRKKEDAFKSVAGGFGIAVALLAVTAALGIAVYGPEGTARRTFPTVDVARTVGIGEFLQRVDVVFVEVWFVSAILKVALMFYAGAASLAQALGFKDHWPCAIPIGIFVFSLAMIPENMEQLFSYADVLKHYGLYYGYGLLFLVLGMSLIRGKGGRRSGTRKGPEGSDA